MKNFKVYFAHTSVGQDAHSMAADLQHAHERFGEHMPPIDLGGEHFQMRDLQRVGTVWKGVFAKLREDAPHIVDAANKERELELELGDRVVDKLHFLYRERPNVLVWQVNRNAGGLARMQDYLHRLFEDYAQLVQVMNTAELQRVLDGSVYELSFAYARPPNLPADAPAWNQHSFDMMANVHAAQAKFLLRAPRNASLAETSKRMIRQMLGSTGIEKVRVRLSDETDPVELFMAPLRDTIRVQLVGRYPVPADVYQALEEVYERHRDQIAPRTPGD
jgi:hypothetical protein